MAYDLKVLGYGTVVKVDDDDSGSGFTTVGGSKEITPPAKEWFEVDGTTLDDAFEVMDPGIAKSGQFTFTQIWIVNSTNHQILDTLHAAKTKVLWQVVYPQGTPVTDQFEGWVQKLAPAVKGNNEYWTREVTVRQTTAISRS